MFYILAALYPLLCAVAGLFGQLALGAGESVFAGFELAGRQFPQKLPSGVTVLALDDDPGIFLVFRAVDGQDDHAAVVADDVAFALAAAGLDQLVVEHAEERALIDDHRAEQLLLLRHGWSRRLGELFGLGLLRFCGRGFGGDPLPILLGSVWFGGGGLLIAGHSLSLSSRAQ